MNKVTKGIVIAIIVIVLILLAPIVLIFTTVAGATYYNKAQDYIAGKTYAKPVMNLHPTRFLTVKGRVDPNLKIVWHIEYGTQNPKCEITTNWLEGVTDGRGRDFAYSVTPEADGYYTLQLPLDKLKPGMCKWAPLALYYDAKTTKGLTYNNINYDIVFVKKASDKIRLPFKVVAYCKHSIDQEKGLDCSNHYLSSSVGFPLTLKSLYVDFIWQKHKQ